MYSFKPIVNESTLGKEKIHLIGGHPVLVRSLGRILKKNGLLLSISQNHSPSEDIFQEIIENTPDIIVIDLGLFDRLCKICRILGKNETIKMIPKIVLGDKNSTQREMIKCIEHGADDYLVEPAVKVLFAKINAFLRRTRLNKEPDEFLKFGKITMNITAHTLHLGKKSLNVTPKEFALLFFLIKRKRQALSRKFLMQSIWEQQWYGDPRTINKHIETLRRKLGKSCGDRIKTVKGFGYKLI